MATFSLICSSVSIKRITRIRSFECRQYSLADLNPPPAPHPHRARLHRVQHSGRRCGHILRSGRHLPPAPRERDPLRPVDPAPDPCADGLHLRYVDARRRSRRTRWVRTAASTGSRSSTPAHAIFQYKWITPEGTGTNTIE